MCKLSCNMISVISNMGNLSFMVFEDTFNSDVFIEFMQRLVRNHDRKIFLILDNLNVHHSKKSMVNYWWSR
ncbi:MAG: transposase [Desulfobacterales bacterium]|nr:transposase [Desulfobacterales bacterium]